MNKVRREANLNVEDDKLNLKGEGTTTKTTIKPHTPRSFSYSSNTVNNDDVFNKSTVVQPYVSSSNHCTDVYDKSTTSNCMYAFDTKSTGYPDWFYGIAMVLVVKAKLLDKTTTNKNLV